MTKLDEDVVAVVKVPGHVWDLRFKGENARPPETSLYGRKDSLTRVLGSLKSHLRPRGRTRLDTEKVEETGGFARRGLKKTMPAQEPCRMPSLMPHAAVCRQIYLNCCRARWSRLSLQFEGAIR